VPSLQIVTARFISPPALVVRNQTGRRTEGRLAEIVEHLRQSFRLPGTVWVAVRSLQR
jgi:hypothetical protein